MLVHFDPVQLKFRGQGHKWEFVVMAQQHLG